ncbi:ribosome maturation factor RimM [Aureimonas psammosilenae]|uniref:ribosome maturation factor RimM n=1 Tax=Aureimonas psammosilenae TaxID=2495496 RepID=UPI001260E7C3|nr:ribosome maturation factor RimM [Aureimonas psammosilenae]
MADTAPSHPVLLGIVGGAHGLKGECRVSSFTAEPQDLGAYGPLFDKRGARYTVLSARIQKNVVVVRFEEVRDRDQAERLNGTELFVDRSSLPEDEEDDDFYIADLVGLQVVTVAGEAVGTVVAVHDFGAGDILEIAPERGQSVMIPFSEAAVPEVDLDGERIVVEPVAAGLVEAKPEPGEDGAPTR